ncbi:acetyltransferase [Flavisolibacter tropicus]|uniref:PglD N-terminal domain-containing protein n=1 Tax=Flavisolibacter tropicus TaxID=1492898 RepID=A0A172TZD2_9BACT|nr:acetyltransferase [Flavisolibacter tropicus]ANE52445.1 hypothetical protein SY85_20125 [Flavisolibacter tropicus]
MYKLAIIGSGDLGQLIAHHAINDRHYEVVGFFDDFKNAGEKVGLSKVIGSTREIFEKFSEGVFDKIMIGIGYNHFQYRKDWYNKLKARIPLGTIIHSSTYIDTTCKVGEGVFILPGCVLDTNVIIGDNVLLNTGTTIAHDSMVKANSFLSPRVAVAGFVSIGECCNIGINTTIIDNISITDFVQTGGGAVVVKNLQQPGLYIGVPARLKSKN